MDVRRAYRERPSENLSLSGEKPTRPPIYYALAGSRRQVPNYIDRQVLHAVATLC